MAKIKQVQIIYQDDNILVANKPTGVSVTKDRSGDVQLVDLLAKQIGSGPAKKLRLVHRIDKLTSGILILAKNPETQSAISSSFEKRLVKKTYLAITTGIATSTQGQINAGITNNLKFPGKMCLTRRKSKKAKTNWKLLADFDFASLLAVSPVTGRTHQIRVHLPSIAMPLAIDPLYGSKRGIYLSDFKGNYRLAKGQTEPALMDRLTLHAYQITLTIPPNNEPQTFVAPLDKKFKAVIKMLTKHNHNGPDAFVDKDDFKRIINALPLT